MQGHKFAYRWYCRHMPLPIFCEDKTVPELVRISEPWTAQRENIASHKQLFLSVSACLFWQRFIYKFKKHLMICLFHVIMLIFSLAPEAFHPSPPQWEKCCMDTDHHIICYMLVYMYMAIVFISETLLSFQSCHFKSSKYFVTCYHGYMYFSFSPLFIQGFFTESIFHIQTFTHSCLEAAQHNLWTAGQLYWSSWG